MARTYTIPGLDDQQAARLQELLQQRLVALLDLQLTLKHVHWNLVGPRFIGVHEMLDPQVAGVRRMSDEVAERIATLGSEPLGTPGSITKLRTWDDYDLGRDTVLAHLGALDIVYRGVIGDHRSAIEESEDLDRVTQDLLIRQSGHLEMYHWFVRAHLESSGGRLRDEGAHTEVGAADRARGE